MHSINFKRRFITRSNKPKRLLLKSKSTTVGAFSTRAPFIPKTTKPSPNCFSPSRKVVVESHPTLVTHSAMAFADRLRPRLEIAMGLECAEDTVLHQLNKALHIRRLCESRQRARKHSGIGHRALRDDSTALCSTEEALGLCLRTVDFALPTGADRVSLIPTRSARCHGGPQKKR